MKNIYSIVRLGLYLICFVSFAQRSQVEDIKTHLQVLTSDEFTGRETGKPGLNKAANYISKYFKSIQIKPYFISYKDTFYTKNLKAYNVVGYIEGSEEYLKNKPLLITAHYDHIGIRKPVDGDSIANGANDNASGTVAVMQLAKNLKASKPKRPIVFVLFDAEEQGLQGSKFLAQKFKTQDIKPYVVFNIEMIGVPMKDKESQAYFTGYEKSNLAKKFNGYAQKEVLIFSPQASKYKLFRRSDNYPFYSTFSIPSHTASSFDFTNYDYYHQVDDEFEKLDIEHMNNLINSWVQPLLDIANHKENLIKLIE